MGLYNHNNQTYLGVLNTITNAEGQAKELEITVLLLKYMYSFCYFRLIHHNYSREIYVQFMLFQAYSFFISLVMYAIGCKSSFSRYVLSYISLIVYMDY